MLILSVPATFARSTLSLRDVSAAIDATGRDVTVEAGLLCASIAVDLRQLAALELVAT